MTQSEQKMSNNIRKEQWCSHFEKLFKTTDNNEQNGNILLQDDQCDVDEDLDELEE